jgi:ubiquitin C-terminal hydrolase
MALVPVHLVDTHAPSELSGLLHDSIAVHCTAAGRLVKFTKCTGRNMSDTSAFHPCASRLQEQEAAETKEYGAGLVNLGNTCYMNSCLQCLYAVPDLHTALANVQAGAANSALATQGGNLFKQMSKGGTVTPAMFVMTLRRVAPQFNDMSQHVVEGKRVHAQQDAEECWRAVRLESRQLARCR